MQKAKDRRKRHCTIDLSRTRQKRHSRVGTAQMKVGAEQILFSGVTLAKGFCSEGNWVFVVKPLLTTLVRYVCNYA